MYIDRLIGTFLCGFSRAITGARSLWLGCSPAPQQRIYFANHRSHGDFLLIWAALPSDLRKSTCPVAGADYWLKGRLRRYLITKVFNAVLVDRSGTPSQAKPLDTLLAALGQGHSLIIFPEGTRNMGEGTLPFKSGLYHMARAFPQVELVPVWIDNLGRVMPKGSYVPVPLLCSISFGAPLVHREGETKSDFLERAAAALLQLSPPQG